MATETVVHDQKRWAMAAMERRLAVAKAQLLQQQQKIEKDNKATSDVDVSSKEPLQADSLPTPSKTSIKKGLMVDYKGSMIFTINSSLNCDCDGDLVL